MAYRRHALWVLVVLACLALLMAPALWNGFPLLQYDTGGYLSPWFDGRLHTNRSVPYGLLLILGQRPDFWPVVIVQSLLTVWVLALTLRAHGFGGRPLLLLAIVTTLSIFTTLPWLTAVLLTDIFSGLAVLALYLLLLREETLSKRERIGLLVFVAASAATHSATIAVLSGLVIVAAIASFFDSARIPFRRVLRTIAAMLFGALMVVTANALVVGRLSWAPGGYALSFGRMLQDGIVKKYLDDHCPDASLRLCPYKDQLPRRADEFFWEKDLFTKLGRFDGLHDEMRRIVFESLTDYPMLQLQSMVSETVKAAHHGRDRRRRGQMGHGQLLQHQETCAARAAGAECVAPVAQRHRLYRDQSAASPAGLLRDDAAAGHCLVCPAPRRLDRHR